MDQFSWPEDVRPATFAEWRLANPTADVINLSLNRDLQDSFLEQISGIKHINLWSCKGLTNAGIMHLRGKGIKTIDITSCPNLTDEIAPVFEGITSISIGSNPNLTDRVMEHFSEVDYFDGSSTQITDAGLAHLKDARVVRVPSCKLITDVGLGHLNSVTHLAISNCPNITNLGLVPLVGLVELRMRTCIQPTITNEAFASLKNLKDLDVTGCVQLTDEMFQYISGIESLTISQTKLTGSGISTLVNLKQLVAYSSIITDEALASLRGLEYLDVSDCNVTDAAFANLQGIRELHMGKCSQITDAGFAALDGIKKLDITKCKQPALTDAAFTHLRGIETLIMDGCVQITDAALANLTGIRILSIDGCSPNLEGPNLQALHGAGATIEGDLLDPADYEVSTHPWFQLRSQVGTLSGREDLDIPLPVIESLDDDYIRDVLEELPLPDEIVDIQHGSISFMKFAVLNYGSGLIFKVDDSYSSISRRDLLKELKSGNSTYYECSRKFTGTFEYSDIIKTPYFALKTSSGSLYIKMRDALTIMIHTHSFWKLSDSGYTIAFSASRSGVLAGGPIMSADHCQGDTAKKIYEITPIAFELPTVREDIPNILTLKFGEESIQIPFVPTQTITEVRAAITAKWPELTHDKQRLFYNGRMLERGVLEEERVKPDTTIMVMKKGGRKTYRWVKKNKTKKRPSS